MVTIERLDELESRILRALELISDLRSENSRLEQENIQVTDENNISKEKLANKDREIADLRTQFEVTSREFGELKTREEKLETKIDSMLSRLSNLQSAEASSPLTQKENIVSAPHVPSATIIESPPQNTPDTTLNDTFYNTPDDTIIQDDEDSSLEGVTLEENTTVKSVDNIIDIDANMDTNEIYIDEDLPTEEPTSTSEAPLIADIGSEAKDEKIDTEIINDDEAKDDYNYEDDIIIDSDSEEEFDITNDSTSTNTTLSKEEFDDILLSDDDDDENNVEALDLDNNDDDFLIIDNDDEDEA